MILQKTFLVCIQARRRRNTWPEAEETRGSVAAVPAVELVLYGLDMVLVDHCAVDHNRAHRFTIYN